MSRLVQKGWVGLWVVGMFGACQGKIGHDVGSHETRSKVSHSGVQLKGQLAKSGSRRRATEFRYDLLGRPVHIRHQIDGQRYDYGADYAYVGGAKQDGELGNRLTITRFPDNECLFMHFDAAGQLQRLTSQLESAYSDLISSRTKFNRFGQVEWSDSGNHIRTHHVYNSLRQPIFVVTETLQQHEVLQAFGYAYDLLGRVTEVRDYCTQTETSVVCCDPREASCSQGPLSARYEYDVAGWLKTMTTDTGSQTFKADAIGNLIEKAGALQTYHSPLHPHAVTEVIMNDKKASYAYNTVGALTSMTEDGVATQFAWNARNMPVHTQRQQDSTERFYLGEALYKRIDSINGVTSTTLFLPGLRVEDGVFRKFYGNVAERESNAAMSKEGEVRRGTLRFRHVDHLGSSTLVTDEAGQVVSRTSYAPFGEERQVVGSFTSKRQFTSKEKEPLTGLYDFGARLYNPRTGRFLSPDSVMDGLNAYSYVFNNPIHFVDPDGHQTQTPRDVRNQIVIREFMDVIGKVEKRGFWELVKSAGRKTGHALRNFFTPKNDSSLSMGMIQGLIHDGLSSQPLGMSAPRYIDPRIFQNKTEVAKGWVKGAANLVTGTVNWFYPEWEQAYGSPILPTLASSNVFQSYGQVDAAVASTLLPGAVAKASSKLNSVPVTRRTAHALEDVVTRGPPYRVKNWVTRDDVSFELELDGYSMDGFTQIPAVTGPRLHIALSNIFKNDDGMGYGIERFIEASLRSAELQGLSEVEIELHNVVNYYVKSCLEVHPRFSRVQGSATADFVGVYKVGEYVEPILKHH